MSPELEHQINQSYEAYLDEQWERYNEEGEPDEDNYEEDYYDQDYDRWAQDSCEPGVCGA